MQEMESGEWQKCCEILGVSESHTAEELRTAYKKQALAFHPDKNPNGKDSTPQFQVSIVA